MTSRDHPAVSTFATALRQAGRATAAEAIQILDEEVRTAALAARALGVFRSTQGHRELPLLVLTSGAHRADPARLAALVGARQVTMADPAFVRKHTGQAIGGVAPAGHPRPVRTLVDRHLERHRVVWAAAGHPRAIFPTTFAELLDLTGGVAADVALVEEHGSL